MASWLHFSLRDYVLNTFGLRVLGYEMQTVGGGVLVRRSGVWCKLRMRIRLRDRHYTIGLGSRSLFVLLLGYLWRYSSSREVKFYGYIVQNIREYSSNFLVLLLLFYFEMSTKIQIYARNQNTNLSPCSNALLEEVESIESEEGY